MSLDVFVSKKEESSLTLDMPASVKARDLFLRILKKIARTLDLDLGIE